MALKMAAGLSVLKSPYLLSVPVAGVTAASGYSIYQNHDLISAIEDDYLARVRFEKGKDDKKIEGKSIDLSQEDKLKEIIQQDKQRLAAFYRKYSTNPTYVNTPTTNNDGSIDFFVHVKGKNSSMNKNNVWLDNVHLNQLSIDRYGFEYDETGKKKTDSTEAKLHKIIDWNNIAVSDMSRDSLIPNLPSIAFNFYDKEIPKNEIDILSYKEKDKYQIEEQDKSSDASKDWFVWLDKEILTLKLNYALQTWAFNQQGAESQQQIKSILGDSIGNTQTDDQKAKRREIKENYDSLPEAYKTFAKDYVSTFIDTSSTNGVVSDWGKVVNNVTTTDNFIKTDDLNKIYNRFQKSSKSVELFTPHLVTKITAGDVGNWQVSLDLKKEKKDEKETEKQEEQQKPKEFESRKIEPITDSTNDENKKKNAIYLIIDPSTNKELNLAELFDKVKNYSVRNLTLTNDKNSHISSVYSATGSDRAKESLHVLHLKHKNEYGLYIYEKWLPIILGTLFVVGIIGYLAMSFKAPGALVGAGIVASAVNVMGVFFALGSKLSLVGIAAAFVGVFFALFLSFYFLNFLKKIFAIEFLDKSNIWALFKRGIALSTDLSLPVFVVSSFIAFMAPVNFREFGIVLTLFVLVSYLFVSVTAFLLALNFTSRRFAKMSVAFAGDSGSNDIFLSSCLNCLARKNSTLFSLAPIALIVLVGIIILFTTGFSSFSFLKNNYLVTFSDSNWALQSNKSAQSTQISTQLSDVLHKTIGSADDIKAYLISADSYSFDTIKNTLSTNLNEGAYSITSTDAFKDWISVQDVFRALGFSLALICVYVLIRFKFKSLFIFLFNTIISSSIFISLLLITRVPINETIFVSVCSFFTISVVYHIVLFSLHSVPDNSVYAPLVNEINHRIYSKLKFSVLWFVVIALCTAPSSLFMTFAYLSASLIFAHVLITFIYYLISNVFTQIQNKYEWVRFSIGKGVREMEVRTEFDLAESYLDEQDEELIFGINKSI